MRFTPAILTIVLTYTWVLEPSLPPSFRVAPVCGVLFLGAWNALRTGEWGLVTSALLPGFRAAFLFTVPMIGIMLGAGVVLHTLHGRREPLIEFLALVPWGGGQQWILQTVLLREAQRSTSRRAGILVAAILFASLHLPNPFLTAMTFVGALGWCAIYDRYPNVIPLAVSHALATSAILHAFDDAITGRLRVGAAF